jgi:acyl-[acyl-carrier-protein]-phospholipid O-acyltransferase/long-chain-fatty-acid--[acyl-carrier-protein] ligase
MVLQQIFIETAKRYPKRLAFNDRSLSKQVTFARALIGCLILSKKLRTYDDGFLGIMLPTSAGAALATIATLMAGKIPVMINYSTGAKKNTQFAQKKCNFDVVITSRKLLEKIDCPELPGMCFLEDLMAGVTRLDKLLAALQSKFPARLLSRLYRGDSEQTSVVLFTSGSEKAPKAVPLTHSNIVSNIEGFINTIGLRADDKMLVILPFFHVFGLTANLWTPLYLGMTSIMYANPLDYREVARVIREERPTVMVGTPVFFRGYLLRSQEGDYEQVRLAIVGADKCPESLRTGFQEKHNLTILEGYGVTETSPVISVNLPDANKPGSTGRPIQNVEVRIENYETNEPCNIGEVGKILTRGPCMMKGYFDDLEETSLRIRNGWYDTGDMGYLDEDGFLWHVGRLKRFVKIAGEMVSLVAVEEALGRVLPATVECCVVEVPDAVKGARIIAVVTREIDRKEVLKRLSQTLPNIALPRHFVVVEELPKMGSGKVDFRTTTEIVKELSHSKQVSLTDKNGA